MTDQPLDPGTFAGVKVRPTPTAPASGLPAPESLIDVLDLHPDIGGDPDRFVGYNPPTMLSRTFGGQVLGQSLIAAGRTVDGDRPVHSLHAYFLRAGDPSRPITFSVERLRDGRSFSARRIHALQAGEPILSMIASFQEPSEGLDHQDSMPDVPSPESLPTLTERYPDIPPSWNWVGNRSVDIRHVDEPIYLKVPDKEVADQCVWIRCTVDLPPSQQLHTAALAYLSDFNLLEPALRKHGLAWIATGLKVASLDHAMWFHRPIVADEWLLYVQHSPSTSGARGLSIGSLYSRSGALVATVAQEGMIRVPPRG